jgi:ankyrin repeat protein
MPSKSEVIPEWVKTCAQDKNILDLEPFTSSDDPAKIFRIRSLAKNGNGNKDECFRFQSIYDEVKESTVTGNHPLNPLTRKPLLESEVTAFHKMRAEKFPELPRLDYPPSDKAVNMRHVQDAFENMSSDRITQEAYAAEVARIDTILSRKIVDEQSSNEEHRTLLVLATMYELTDMIKRFLPKSDVNKGDLNFATPLHYACRRNNSEIIRLLMAAGAKTDVKNKSGTFPIREALSFSFSPKQLEAIKTMVAAGANPNVTDDDEMTLLMSASKLGDAYLDIVKYLLSLPTVNVDAVDVSGNTALMYAAQSGYPDVVNYLLSKKPGNFLNKQNKSAYDLCGEGAKKHMLFISTKYYTPPMPKRYQDILDILKTIPVQDEPPVPVSLQVNSAAIKANKLAALEARVNLYMATHKLKRKTAEKYAQAYVAVIDQRNALDDAAEKAGIPVDESKYLPLPPVPPSDVVPVIHNPFGAAQGPAQKAPVAAAHGRPSGPIGTAPTRLTKAVAAAAAAPSPSFLRLTAAKKAAPPVVAPAASVKLAAAPSPAKSGNLLVVGTRAIKKGGARRKTRKVRR